MSVHLGTGPVNQVPVQACIADPKTRNQLLWDYREMSLSQMIEKFEDFKGAESFKVKKTLRMTQSSSVTDQLKTKLA